MARIYSQKIVFTVRLNLPGAHNNSICVNPEITSWPLAVELKHAERIPPRQPAAEQTIRLIDETTEIELRGRVTRTEADRIRQAVALPLRKQGLHVASINRRYVCPGARCLALAQGAVCPPPAASSQTVFSPFSYTEAGPIDGPCQEVEFGIRRSSAGERKEVNHGFFFFFFSSTTLRGNRKP